ncbi:MAG: DUF4350 domain-containing protein [Candidatus Lokiarchaeota archaeon]|nr:DUF4350 domain-containing protein [Candidatus Lokiarchaeota archaeon]
MNTKKKNSFYKVTILLVIIAGFTAFSMNLITVTPAIQQKNLNNPESSQYIPSEIRVAIYNEPNVTRPSYTAIGILTNNYSLIELALNGAGYQVSTITTEQIYNHELLTSNYDVFIMADNLPKVNITNQVKEFWLGGGGLLTFDSVAAYLCWSGILFPESEGSDGFSVYWNNQAQTSANISLRHPVTRGYDIGDTFTFGSSYSWSTFDWTALMGSSIASDLYRLANQPGDLNDVTVLGYDPSDRGGKLVHILTTDELDADNLLINAVAWLCPQPKGKILFDLSHSSRLGVDSWDDLTAYPGYYKTWRNSLVSRGFLFDKLYPSSTENFSSSRLNPYDMLIIVSPDLNYSSNDRTALTNWINNGGSLVVLGDNPFLSDFAITNARINYLLDSFDIRLNTTVGISGTQDLSSEEHPTTEGCSIVTAYSAGTVNISGDAFEIWGYSTNVIIAGQELGSGRLMVIGDMNWCAEGNIGTNDNEQFAINLANWLISWNADILIYTDDPFSANFYKSPLCRALNSLKINFYLTFSSSYFNYSLTNGSWELLIINLVNYGFANSILDNIKNFVDTGGYLLMSSYVVSSNPTHELWATLGFAYASNMPDNEPFYIWDDTHTIFNKPFDYDATLFQPFIFYSDDGDLLTVYDNATALAGYTASEAEGNATIILRNDKHTLYNGYIIDELSGDNDFNGFEDRLELWTNEILFMLDQAGLLPDGQPAAGIPGYELITMLSVFGIVTCFLIITKRKKN